MTRTTPPRPADAAAVLPQLGPLARTATRLHPRPGSPSARDSSVGGPLLWPAGEPWPYCDGPHVPDGANPVLSPEDVRARRRIMAAAAIREEGDPRFTSEESAALDRINEGRPLPAGPLAMLPVAQLYVRDIPLLRPPGQADLLQVLWCPFDHAPDPYPRTDLSWRTAAEVTDILSAAPEPAVVQFEGYVPEPCLLHPEQVTEYPHLMDLDEELQALLEQWSTWRTAGATPDSYYEPAPQEFYRLELSTAPGWKVGGWPSWGLTDPVHLSCPACGTRMDPLLAIASNEWDAGNHSWIPVEYEAHAESGAYPDLRHPTMIQIGDDYRLQVYACPTSPDHPHTELMQ
jgi:hypothetical protein